MYILVYIYIDIYICIRDIDRGILSYAECLCDCSLRWVDTNLLN